MTIESIQQFGDTYPYIVIPVILILAYLLYRGTRFILARSAYSIALRTESVYDDLFVDRLQPFRFAWLLPLILIYIFSDTFFDQITVVKTIALLLIIWVSADFVIAILSGINDVYKHNPRYTGVSVAGYIGILKVVTVVAAIILTIAYFFEIEPVVLLSGVGAWLAVLLLIFRDTILSFVASVQISTQKLIKEGDTVDIPAFGANGTVANIDLQAITVQNFDNTITTVPTSKIVEVGFKNYRVMLESGTRRLKQAILINVKSIHFVDTALIDKINSVDFIARHVEESISAGYEQTTNLELYMKYVEGYLKNRKDVRKRRYPLVVRTLKPTESGIPLEVYIYVKAPDWNKFEEIQAQVTTHLLAILDKFDLQPFSY